MKAMNMNSNSSILDVIDFVRILISGWPTVPLFTVLSPLLFVPPGGQQMSPFWMFFYIQLLNIKNIRVDWFWSYMFSKTTGKCEHFQRLVS
jgi:hypothetical protein